MKRTLRLIVHYGRYRTWAPMLAGSIFLFCSTGLVCCARYHHHDMSYEALILITISVTLLPWIYMIMDILSTVLAEIGVYLILRRKPRTVRIKRIRRHRGEIRQVWDENTHTLVPDDGT